MSCTVQTQSRFHGAALLVETDRQMQTHPMRSRTVRSFIRLSLQTLQEHLAHNKHSVNEHVNNHGKGARALSVTARMRVCGDRRGPRGMACVVGQLGGPARNSLRAHVTHTTGVDSFAGAALARVETRRPKWQKLCISQFQRPDVGRGASS